MSEHGDKARALLDAVEAINEAFARVAVPLLYTAPMDEEIVALRGARDRLRTALSTKEGERDRG